jgi:carbonic anhydrase
MGASLRSSAAQVQPSCRRAAVETPGTHRFPETRDPAAACANLPRRVDPHGHRVKFSRRGPMSTLSTSVRGVCMTRTGTVAALAIVFAATVAAADTGTPAVTAREALGMLKAGNDRFARNASKPVSLSVNRRRELAGEEQPTAMILSCADSRVPPEHVFNTGLGELFVIRAAGEVIDRSVLATVEYGAAHLHVPLLVVMGHESCDVVKAAKDAKGTGESPNLDYLLKAIRAAHPQTAEERDDIKTLIIENVEQVINDALGKSPLLRRMVDEGRLDVVGAYFELVSGRVIFSEPVSPGTGAASGASRPAGARH